MEKAKPTEEMKVKIRDYNDQVKKFFKEVSGHCHFDPKSIGDQFDKLMTKDKEYRHIISLLIVDEIKQDVNYIIRPPIKVISSRFKKKSHMRRLSVKLVMPCVLGLVVISVHQKI